MKTFMLFIWVFCISFFARADVIDNVDLSTVPLSGVSGFFVIDFLGGTPPPGNTATVSGFTSDWNIISSSPTGGYSGNFVPGPLTLDDSQFFNEWSEKVVFGTHASLNIDLTTIFKGGTPDDFAIYLLDSSGNPYATTDPSGANALLNISIDQMSPLVQAYSSNSATISVSPNTTVPEPSSLFCVVIALAVLLWSRNTRLKRGGQLGPSDLRTCADSPCLKSPPPRNVSA